MAYNGIPVDQPYMPNNVGMAFSKGILTDLLRKKLGLKDILIRIPALLETGPGIRRQEYRGSNYHRHRGWNRCSFRI